MTNGSESGGGGVPDSKKPPEVIKSRIESWLKDAEEDADKAEKYLDKKKANIQRRESGSSFKRKQEHKLAAASSVAKQTDVLKALEVSWRVLLINWQYGLQSVVKMAVIHSLFCFSTVTGG